MSTFLASARHEMLNTRRSRNAHLLLVVFIGMVVASAVIGWVANQTVTRVYEQILAAGLTTAANPFTNVSPLFYERNSVIYVVLIGSLMAIVLGVQATLRDRKASTVDLVLSRPVASSARLLGQLAGLGVVIAAVLAISMSASWVVISIINGAPLGAELSLRLAGFAGLAWVLLTTFALLGMLTGIRSKQETTALLVPFVVWSVVTFVLPQIGTAVGPVSLLNPVPAAATAVGGPFDAVAAVTGPLSVTEQFKTAAGIILQDGTSSGDATVSVLVLLGFLAAMTAIVVATPRNRMRSGLNE